MSGGIHHGRNGGSGRRKMDPPRPSKEPAPWREAFARAFGEDRDTKWGKRIVRLASDMIVVCDDELNILYHNRSFLRGVGYPAGTFERTSLYSFFTDGDRPEAEEAFRQLLAGRSVGMRVRATFLTNRGKRKFDARVTRSRRGSDSFYLYFIMRDETEKVETFADLENHSMEPLFRGLPVAAFRVDEQMKISHAYGELWKAGFQCDEEMIVGRDLRDIDCPPAPTFLKNVDFSDPMIGITLHTEFSFQNASYEIVLEPFLDEGERVMGMIGMIRLANPANSPCHQNRVLNSDRGLQEPFSHDSRSEVSNPEVVADEFDHSRSSVTPRKLRPEDFVSREGEDDCVALSN